MAQVHKGATITAGWAHVMQVDPDALLLHLPPVLDLFVETRKVTHQLDDSAWSSMLEDLDQLFGWAFPNALPWTSTKANRLSGPAHELNTLGMLSSHLHRTLSEGIRPSEDELQELQAEIGDLLESLRVSQIQGPVRTILLKRLQDVQQVMTHLDLFGIDGAREVIDSLGFATATYGSGAADADQPLIARMRSFASRSFRAFCISAMIANGSFTLDKAATVVANALAPSHETRPKEIGPGKSLPTSDDPRREIAQPNPSHGG